MIDLTEQEKMVLAVEHLPQPLLVRVRIVSRLVEKLGHMVQTAVRGGIHIMDAVQDVNYVARV